LGLRGSIREGPFHQRDHRDGQEVLIEVVANVIREKSMEGQLLSHEEILDRLAQMGLPAPKEGSLDIAPDGMLRKAMETNEDLMEIPVGGGEPYYYSGRYMTEPYARILIQKKEAPLLMIAETVRKNSMLYPRPIALDAFQKTPFEMNGEEVEAALERMAGQEDFRDICRTTTSIGTVFLFSTLHLEPDHASMLAEWFDVGQFQNP
jgi:hypothetical protein